MKKLQDKGIAAYAATYALCGIQCRRLGLLAGAVRERRVLEALFGLYCALRPSSPVKTLARRGTRREFGAEFVRLPLGDGRFITSRRQSVSRQGDRLVAGEYGNPGASILYRTAASSISFDPYAKDENVFHIHSITPAGGDLFYVATGDTAKYLDILEINQAGCRIVKRVFRHFGGFTAHSHCGGQHWFGTDFSGRPNYILNLDERRKYILPAKAYGEYVISMASREDHRIEILTKRLGRNEGCLLYFDATQRAFDSLERVDVIEYCSYG